MVEPNGACDTAVRGMAIDTSVCKDDRMERDVGTFCVTYTLMLEYLHHAGAGTKAQ